MMNGRRVWLSLLGGWLSSRVMADQIVYLERPSGGPTWEPYFNPKTVNAAVGETVTFFARFSPLAQDSTNDVSILPSPS
jgi:hypothetical protein